MKKLPPQIVPALLPKAFPRPPKDYVFVGKGRDDSSNPFKHSVENYYYLYEGRSWVMGSSTLMRDKDAYYAFHKSAFAKKVKEVSVQEKIEGLNKRIKKYKEVATAAQTKLQMEIEERQSLEKEELNALIEESGFKIGDIISVTNVPDNKEQYVIDGLKVVNSDNYNSFPPSCRELFEKTRKNFLAVLYGHIGKVPAIYAVKKIFPKVGEKYSGEVIVCGENETEILFKKNKKDFEG